ncbi:hypothetical protein DFJ74DRAFT_669054 [Hyaloraphidium curvatum]|nr:hypothetical protein DFJ74DRAFT_669054 [Hyaloraphidium curvatum]
MLRRDDLEQLQPRHVAQPPGKLPELGQVEAEHVLQEGPLGKHVLRDRIAEHGLWRAGRTLGHGVQPRKQLPRAERRREAEKVRGIGVHCGVAPVRGRDGPEGRVGHREGHGGKLAGRKDGAAHAPRGRGELEGGGHPKDPQGELPDDPTVQRAVWRRRRGVPADACHAPHGRQLGEIGPRRVHPPRAQVDEHGRDEHGHLQRQVVRRA